MSDGSNTDPNDDDLTPPRSPLPKAIALPAKRRLQSATEREVESDTARRQREDAVPEFTSEEDSAVMTIEQRREYRRGRKHSERIERLEDKHDALDEKVGEIREDVREIRDDLREKRKDEADAKKNNRARVTTVIATVCAGGGALLHWIASHL